MEYIGVADMFKVGIGPSSSHTLGPWKAALSFASKLKDVEHIDSIEVRLYGSLSLTGKGHCTDKALIMGLSGYDPTITETEEVLKTMATWEENRLIQLAGKTPVDFREGEQLIFNNEFLQYHPNGMIFTAVYKNGEVSSETVYSIGGGFIDYAGKESIVLSDEKEYPYPVQSAAELLSHCKHNSFNISSVIRANESSVRSSDYIDNYLLNIWEVMLMSIYTGVHTEGILPGGLGVKRRASQIYKRLASGLSYDSPASWVKSLQAIEYDSASLFRWLSAFALAVNEENAAMGRVVTAPTNGSAGVIPAVLLFYLTQYNKHAGNDQIVAFLATASEIGCLFKKGATISAAMGGCQAEIGVSSAMAAAGLTEVLGGSPDQCIIAAEMAMEHHLGLTCDPVDGLVQIPCIERNSMGAIKAITAAQMALDRDPNDVIVPLDSVISTMWETALDMNRKYKETSEGGLAIAVNKAEC